MSHEKPQSAPICLQDCGFRSIPHRQRDNGIFMPDKQVSDFRLSIEHKSRERETLESRETVEQMTRALEAQQKTLQGIVDAQKELRELIEEQHKALEERLAELSAPKPGLFLPLGMSGRKSGDVGQDQHHEVEDQHDAGGSHQEHDHGHDELDHDPGMFSKDKLKQVKKLNNQMSNQGKNNEQPEQSDQDEDFDALELPLPGRSSSKKARDKAAKVAQTPLMVARWLIMNPLFDSIMGVVILLNFAAIFCELQWKGYEVAYNLGLRTDDADWQQAHAVFKIIEKVFNAVYFVELVMRLVTFRLAFFKDCLNVLDGAVVMVSAVDSFIIDPIFGSDGNGSTKVVTLMRLMRILRALRVLRFLRVLRYMEMFSALRVLVKTISMSIDSLVWSMVLMAFIILASAMLMVQLNSSFIEDEAIDNDLRKWMFKYYGSAARASYTMFEASFSAKWATHLARPLVEDINPWWALFWILYTVAVNFAIIRVISALFLKQTMAVAAIDQERMEIQKMKERDQILQTLMEIFHKGDKLGDGFLHRWEFEEMMEQEEVLQSFDTLQLEPIEVFMLYDLLSEDDGKVDQEEFLTGAMKLKNHARTVDMIQVLHQQTVTRRSIEVLKKGIERIDEAIHPRNPWRATHNGFYQSLDPKTSTSQGDGGK